MEVPLADSNICRLCASDNPHGSQLYVTEEDGVNLSELINNYLPLKVADDGKYSRTICPGCAIQLEATVEFFNLIINGQKVLRELLTRQQTEIGSIFENGLYLDDHKAALEMAGLEKPKRKRGRPKKVPKESEDLEEYTAIVVEEEPVARSPTQVELVGKRKRKTPERFKEVVQGKELERIFREEGVIDGDESDGESKKNAVSDQLEIRPVVEEVIGHLHTEDGTQADEPVRITKGKGRGRPKGTSRTNKQRCAICEQEFSCVGRYMSHVAQHGPVIYQCAECDEAFNMRLEFNRHQEESGHAGQRIIKCEREDTESSKKVKEGEMQEVTLNIKQPNSAADESTFIISMCDLTDAKIHILDTEPPAPEDTKPLLEEVVTEEAMVQEEPPPTDAQDAKAKLSCPYCDKVFSSKQNKSVHIKASHMGERPHKCSECDARFAYARSLKLHMVTHRKNKNKGYACDLCGKVLNHPSSVVYHKEAEHAGKKFKCLKCGKLFKHKQLLQRHQLVHSQDRPYVCKICPASFKAKANLVNHQMLHTGVKKYACELCKQHFAHKTSLTLHMRWHSGQKPFECTMCGKRFSQRGNLHEHTRTHTGEKPFKCNLCASSFATSSQYRMHRRRHTGEKPFECTHCGKRFVSGEAWRVHVRRELGQLEHWCSVCGRGFAERWAMLKHQRCHTGEKPFQCPHCPRAFADCSNLTKHKKIHKMSLLSQEKKPAAASPAPAPSPAPPSPDDEENVIYVEYSIDGESDETRLIKLDPEQLASLGGSKVLTGTAELYSEALLANEHDPLTMERIQDLPQEIAGLQTDMYQEDIDTEYMMEEHMSVTDEDGNPIQLTMITSVDGKSYQVLTQDGQSIPVEIDETYKVENVMETDGSEVGVGVETGRGVQMLTLDDTTIAQLLNIS